MMWEIYKKNLDAGSKGKLVLNIKGCEFCVSKDMSLLIQGKQSLNFYFIFPAAAWLKPLSIVGLAMALREQ